MVCYGFRDKNVSAKCMSHTYVDVHSKSDITQFSVRCSAPFFCCCYNIFHKSLFINLSYYVYYFLCPDALKTPLFRSLAFFLVFKSGNVRVDTKYVCGSNYHILQPITNTHINMLGEAEKNIRFH